ncbi:hypothetical protein RvY_05064 [Ramazzottius varieornatus]|uniref:Cysteine protease n=1 Tax=Ramazzottius varieornatus TaxID=947166 RepID=A0A1D1UXB4_RAMVA|nr:hypothetical protein RvY_05064 [Ramazzottius varieornatus]
MTSDHFAMVLPKEGASSQHEPTASSSSTSSVIRTRSVRSKSGKSHAAAKFFGSKKLVSGPAIGISNGENFIFKPTKSERARIYVKNQWNNVMYGFHLSSKVSVSSSSPIWMLGRCYTMGNSKRDDMRSDVNREFAADFRTRLWFTYRRHFPVISGSQLTTDCGWGCCLRSGQILLAEGLVRHFLGRNWRWEETDDREQEVFHRQIIRWFGDFDRPDNLFGIHRLVNIGIDQQHGRKAGDWYGPASLALILQRAMSMARSANPLLQDIQLYVSKDCSIFKGDVLELLADRLLYSTSTAAEPRALIIIVPVRLGSSRMNPLYIPCIKELLTMEYSIGITGGRPAHSLHFVGWQDNSLISVDPHLSQQAVDVDTRSFPLSSFHCSTPHTLPVKKMDPSCALGFYFANIRDFYKFEQISSEVQNLHCKGFPVFTFAEGHCRDYEHNLEERAEWIENNSNPLTSSNAGSDYVIL